MKKLLAVLMVTTLATAAFGQATATLYSDDFDSGVDAAIWTANGDEYIVATLGDDGVVGGIDANADTWGGSQNEYLTPDIDGDLNLAAYQSQPTGIVGWTAAIPNTGILPGGVRIVGATATLDHEVSWTRNVDGGRASALGVNLAGSGQTLLSTLTDANSPAATTWLTDAQKDAGGLSDRGLVHSATGLDIYDGGSLSFWFGNTYNSLGVSNAKLMNYGVDNLVIDVDYWAYGDADENQKVDTTDFEILRTNFAPTDNGIDETWAQADFNNDAKVDTVDFEALRVNFAPIGYAPAAGEIEMVLGADGEIKLVGNAATLTSFQVTSAANSLIEGAMDLSGLAGFISFGSTTEFASASSFAPYALDGEVSLGVLYDTSKVNDLEAKINGVDVTIVPEPATMSLLAIGGLVALKRRRKS